MQRKLITAMLALAVAASASAQVKIGFMAELSGPQAPLGQDQYDAFMLAVEQNGGKLGGVPVQIIKEDSQLKPDVANQLVDKLIDKDKVSIITGLTFSNVLMAVAKKVTDRGVFLISGNAGPSPLAGAQCNPYFFSAGYQNDGQAEGVGKYAADKGYKNVIALAPNYQAGKDSVAGFKRFFKTPLVDEIYTGLSQQDFSAEIATIAAKKPDALYLFYPGGFGINFLKQLQQAGLNKSLTVFSVSTADGTTLPALRDSALGVFSGTFWGPDFPNEANQKFVAAFEKKYGRIPSQYAASSYETALLIDSALKRTKGNVSDKKALHAALKAADFKSIRGAFKFGSNQYPIEDIYVFEVTKDAQGRATLRTIAKPLPAHVDAYAAQCHMKPL